MIARDKPWHLSPAYDLTPTPHVSLERRDLALICGNQGRIAPAFVYPGLDMDHVELPGFIL